MIKINNIKATNMELTDAISDYVLKRVSALEKLIDKNDTSISLDIEVGQTTRHHHRGNIFRSEMNLHIGGEVFRTVSEKDNLYAAIDVSKGELLRVLRKRKTKRHTLLRRGGKMIKNMLRRKR